MKILITGASGFIGTNLLEHLLLLGHEVLNIDSSAPRCDKHIKFWEKADICDLTTLESLISVFSPEFIIHLAAKTDLNEENGIEYYNANIKGVENIIEICLKLKSLKRVIFASSMLVNEVGYKPKDVFDYNPHTLYGKSKVMGEKLILENSSLPEFCIIRPTSIWGEWFGEPYRNFFDYVINGKFVHPGSRACTKTYGYIGNAVYQIEKLLFAEKEKIDRKIFYIGDRPPINISDWADEIASLAGLAKPKKVPFFVFSLAAFVGDLLKKLNIPFPMTSFRLKNMTTDHIVELDNTYDVCSVPPYGREEGIIRTLKWLGKLC